MEEAIHVKINYEALKAEADTMAKEGSGYVKWSEFHINP